MEQNKFNDWADYYFTKDNLNQFLRLQQCIDDCNTRFGLNLSKETFRGCLLRWCEQYGYELDPYPLRSNGILRHRFKGLNGMQEAIYIKKTDFPKQPEATSSQWELYINFEGGYYSKVVNSFDEALRLTNGFRALVGSIERLRISALVPEKSQEAANDTTTQ